MSTYYTINDYITISDALYVASIHLDTAYNLLDLFLDEYTDCASNREKLLEELTTRPEKIEALLRAIGDQLFEVKKEIDLYEDIDSGAVQYMLREAEEKKSIIEMYQSGRRAVS